MSSSGHHASVHLGANGAAKLPILPTPGAIRKTPNPKPKQRKSRTGCMTCKTKRLKCDETKPFCMQCTKKGIVCEGYAKNFKWKSFEDIQEQKKNAPVRRRSSALNRRSEEDDIGEIMDIDVASESAKSPADLMPPPRVPSQSSPFNNFSFTGSPSWEYGSPNGYNSVPSSNSSYSNFFSPPKSEPSPKMAITSILCDPADPNVYTPPVYESPSVKKEPILSPSAPLVTRTPPPIQGIQPMWKFEVSDFDESSDDSDDDIEEFPRPSSSNSLTIGAKRRRMDPDWCRFNGNREELQLWHFYNHVTSPILSVKNAMGENPWRDELIQRAITSPSAGALKHALFAMTSFHMKLWGLNEPHKMQDLGIIHTNRAFNLLVPAVMKDRVEANENNIAAMLVLSFSEVWDDPQFNDGRTHVRAATSIIDRHLRRLHRKNKQVSPFMRFLYNTWLYLDVLSSLSSGDDPCCLKSIGVMPSSPAMSPLSEGFTLQNEIDSLLGCAGDLFPLIARASRISNRLREKVLEDTDLRDIAEAITIRQELLDWSPPDVDVIHASKDQHCSLADIVRTAEVYRQTTLLHLYRAFPPLGKDCAVLADNILDALLLIPKESGVLCIHIWPLMASGCEQTDPKKRKLIRERFEDVRQKLRVGNVDQAIELLEEIWKRKDKGFHNVGWFSMAKERGWHLLLG